MVSIGEPFRSKALHSPYPWRIHGTNGIFKPTFGWFLWFQWVLETSFNVRWSWYPSLSEAHLDVPKIIGNRWPFSQHVSPLWNLQVQQQNDQVTGVFCLSDHQSMINLILFFATFFPVFFFTLPPRYQILCGREIAKKDRFATQMANYCYLVGGLRKKHRLLGGGNSNMFSFTPEIGEYVQFDEHIFQMGWNHQPDQGVCQLDWILMYVHFYISRLYFILAFSRSALIYPCSVYSASSYTTISLAHVLWYHDSYYM